MIGFQWFCEQPVHRSSYQTLNHSNSIELTRCKTKTQSPFEARFVDCGFSQRCTDFKTSEVYHVLQSVMGFAVGYDVAKLMLKKAQESLGLSHRYHKINGPLKSQSDASPIYLRKGKGDRFLARSPVAMQLELHFFETNKLKLTILNRPKIILLFIFLMHHLYLSDVLAYRFLM